MNLPDAALLAGGLATRLGPLTKEIPKAMLDIGGRPFIDWQLERLAAQAVQKVVLCLGHMGSAIQAHVGDGARFGLKVDYAFDGPVALGTGGALKQALSKLGDPFFVLYADSWLDQAWAPVWQRYRAGDCESVMTVLRNQGRWGSSNVFYDHGRVQAYSKNSPSVDFQHIDYGLNLFSHAAFARLPESKFDLGKLQATLARAGVLAGFEVTERFYEIGSPAGLAETRQHLTGRSQ